MSWHFRDALVAEYSAASCSGGEPFALLNGNPTRHWGSVPAPKRWNSSPFPIWDDVRTSTGDRGAEWLTWFLGGFCRTTCPSRGRKDSGGRWATWPLAKWRWNWRPRLRARWKTRQCFLEDSKPFSWRPGRDGVRTFGTLVDTLSVRWAPTTGANNLVLPTTATARGTCALGRERIGTQRSLGRELADGLFETR